LAALENLSSAQSKGIFNFSVKYALELITSNINHFAEDKDEEILNFIPGIVDKNPNLMTSFLLKLSSENGEFFSIFFC
jgi:hypothetical protein